MKARQSELVADTYGPMGNLSWPGLSPRKWPSFKARSTPLGKTLAGLNAQSKGRRLGIFKPHEEKPSKARQKERGEEFWVELCGLPVPSRNTEEGIRAVKRAELIEPDGVRHYLASKFGDDLPGVRAAMQRLAKSYSPKEFAEQAFQLYKRFRPAIPEGVKGWGAKGELDLGLIESLAERNR